MVKLRRLNVIFIILIILIFFFMFSGCSNDNLNSGLKENINDNLIITTFYPTYDITKFIVGNNSIVEVLIPLGVEPHDFQPTPMDIAKFSKASYFVIMGGMFSSIENSIIDNYNRDKIKIINSSKDFIKASKDPHIWMSIDNMIDMTKEIGNSFAKYDMNNSKYYLDNMNKYIAKLEKLKKDYNKSLSNCKYDMILVNHRAYGNIAKEFGFKQISIAGFTPENEPSPKTIQKVIDVAKENNLKYVFIENQMDSKATKTIAEDIGAKILTLKAFPENESENYISMMYDNLNKLKLAMDCK